MANQQPSSTHHPPPSFIAGKLPSVPMRLPSGKLGTDTPLLTKPSVRQSPCMLRRCYSLVASPPLVRTAIHCLVVVAPCFLGLRHLSFDSPNNNNNNNNNPHAIFGPRELTRLGSAANHHVIGKADIIRGIMRFTTSVGY
ncbi:hypothetical protein PIB30_030697 [Stylosanthes scabra]|uniref:Uncharacterized protein n=1 Tax=Stylosanthes scabra TaxID=79078 RepID=A0ABU6SBY6_9FABA|nr:hypothetical protein [Stylosanthes scabra]